MFRRYVLVSAMAALIVAGLGTSTSAQVDLTFGEPTNLGPIVNSASGEGSPTISADGLELYFSSDRPGGNGGSDLWVSTRPSTDAEWGAPENLGPVVNSELAEATPSISADGLTLFFSDWGDPRPGGQGSVDLWVATRASKDDAWGEPVNLGPTINSEGYEVTPEISSDGLELYFESERPGGLGLDDLYVSTRPSTDAEWGAPVNLGPVINGELWEHCPTISSDGLTLFYDLDIPGNLMMTERPTLDAAWGEPVNLGNSASDHYAADLSADGSMLYFTSGHEGGQGDSDIWQMAIIPDAPTPAS